MPSTTSAAATSAAMEKNVSRRRRRGDWRRRTATSIATRSRLAVERREHGLCDDLDRSAGDLARLAQARERLTLGQALLLHQQPFCALDRLPCRERLSQRLGLLAERAQLLVARAGGLDRRQQIGLPERFDEVAEHARLDGA